ncbi:MFS general substrate transporter [Mycena amicta]|nr:MFS general substrate transporter [Mycena amicta]
MASHNAKQGLEGPAAPPYSIFTTREKWFIVSLTAFGTLFSPLSANIYFPAIPTIVVAFHKSTELINLTVTLNMVFQGISPMFWGPLADTYGRRLIFISCLVILALSCVGLALTPTNDYWLLLFLRCFQAIGSASTVAVGAGIIGDISTPAERGGFYGVYSIGPMMGPAVGPVIGGVLSDKLGWRAIFWFLCIASGICAIVLIVFLPETLRAVVGNGSIPGRPFLHTPLVPIIGRGRRLSSSLAVGSRPPPKPFQNPLPLFLQPDVDLILFITGVVYAVFYAVLASISSLFHVQYPQLNQTELGLCFLSLGIGMGVGSVIAGKILDWDYQRAKRKLLAVNGDVDAKPSTEDDFPIEKARLRILPFFLCIFVACCIGYGWCIERGTNLAGPLVLLFFLALVSIGIMNALQTLMLDLVPKQGSSITACNNLVRCGLGAGLVSAIQPMLDALGAGWAYVLLGGLCLVLSLPAVLLLVRFGPSWRARRRRKEEAARLVTG